MGHPWVFVDAHGPAMGRTWISRWYIKLTHGLLMCFRWVYNGSPWVIRGSPVGHPWVTHGSPRGHPRMTHESPMGRLWATHGSPMGRPWVAYGSAVGTNNWFMGHLWASAPPMGLQWWPVDHS